MIVKEKHYLFVPNDNYSGLRLCDDLDHAKALAYFHGGQVYEIYLQDILWDIADAHDEGYPSLYAQQVPLNWSNDNDPTQGQ